MTTDNLKSISIGIRLDDVEFHITSIGLSVSHAFHILAFISFLHDFIHDPTWRKSSTHFRYLLFKIINSPFKLGTVCSKVCSGSKEKEEQLSKTSVFWQLVFSMVKSKYDYQVSLWMMYLKIRLDRSVKSL